MMIGFLGPKATFTDIAVREMFSMDVTVPYSTIPDCFDALMRDEIELAVVPLENALEGSVNITLDYLVHEVDLPIIGEIISPIRQHFMVHPENEVLWKETSIIYSHSHAIAQCHKFLHKELKGIRCESTTSTAAAAQYIKEHPELKAGAIANELAAKEYGLSIVREDIHDVHYNHTRFIILSKTRLPVNKNQPSFKGYKTTVMVTLPADRAGALHQVLSAFAWRKLNLSKIESRPMKTGLGNYFFIIDVDMKQDDVLIPGVVAELEALDCKVKILGSYPFFQLGLEEALTNGMTEMANRGFNG
ncbi:prephenate dehydratase [Cytobacillus eiseniae]|uniref:Prephenate dehydratase n=1 Tax=Cytobacillus eiseniae TaxID=762947 RepID=A0ABS4RE32_9BACI|nr:prephenate dehydratase [Cytobacillus eiseniae]MBP2240569.1 prephenate dehydratase [Cytobacillus eiseniae]